MFGVASYVLGTAAGLVYGPPPPPRPPVASAVSSSTGVRKPRPKRSTKSSSSTHHRGPSISSSATNLNRRGPPRPSNGQRSRSDQALPGATQVPPRLPQVQPPLGRTSSGSGRLRPNGERGAAYDLVDQINRDQDLYHVLGFKHYSFYNRHQIKYEDIRKAYITRSRLCHPDKLPLYPPCTPAFQKLSFAYETLSKPTNRRLYDLSGAGGHQLGFEPATTSSTGRGGSERFKAYRASSANPSAGPSSSAGADETLNGVLHSTFCEFMDGDFEMIRVLINAMNEGNPGLNLGEDAINNFEATFKKLRSLLLAGHKYIKLIRFEIMKLYEIQCSLRSLSYFNVLGRLRLTLALARVTISIPMRIDEAMRETAEGSESSEPGSGILPRGVAGLLEATVAVLERGERATMWASVQTGAEAKPQPTAENPFPAEPGSKTGDQSESSPRRTRSPPREKDEKV